MNTENFTNKLASVLEKINNDALNYVADIRLYPPVVIGDCSIGDCIKAVLGNAVVVGRTFSSTSEDVINGLKSSLFYKGQNSFHPNQNYVGFKQQQKHVSDLVKLLKALLANASEISGFDLKKGHPFYPVFWSFAFNIEVDGEAHILIGSSSD